MPTSLPRTGINLPRSANEELITIVTPATFYRWVRDEKNGKPKPGNPKGGRRKPRKIRELVIETAKDNGLRIHTHYRRAA